MGSENGHFCLLSVHRGWVGESEKVQKSAYVIFEWSLRKHYLRLVLRWLILRRYFNFGTFILKKCSKSLSLWGKVDEQWFRTFFFIDLVARLRNHRRKDWMYSCLNPGRYFHFCVPHLLTCDCWKFSTCENHRGPQLFNLNLAIFEKLGIVICHTFFWGWDQSENNFWD